MPDVKTRLQDAGRLVDLPDRPFDRLVERRARSHRRGRVVSLVVALAIAGGAVGGGLFLLNGIDDDAKDTGTGWQPSRRLALRPGEYFYLQVTSDEAVDGHIRDLETWWAADGSGEVRNRSTRQDKYPYPPSGVYGEDAFPEANDLSWSTDPEGLATRLREGTFEGALVLLLETPYATPELRAALFDVASGLDGVTVIEDVHDPAGRLAVALETTERDGEDMATWRSYFDPGTHQVLAWTFESTRGGSAWILLESAIVGAPGEAPEPDEWLVPPVGKAPA
ncbi:MAG TPA: hypothetical protein VJ887_05820 [Actinomycetota bacterium]|nr:hypothetical protein [Actinomycetota bacterium]